MGLLLYVSEHQRCLPAWGKQDVNKKQKSGGPTLPTYRLYLLRKQNSSLHEISAQSFLTEISSMIQQFNKQKSLSLFGNFPKRFLQLF